MKNTEKSKLVRDTFKDVRIVDNTITRNGIVYDTEDTINVLHMENPDDEVFLLTYPMMIKLIKSHITRMAKTIKIADVEITAYEVLTPVGELTIIGVQE